MKTATNIKPGELDFLDSCADKLDLNDAHNRAIFRGRVAERLKVTTVAAMREWLPGVAMAGRNSAVRAVADAYIAIKKA